jgi:hypothetical protein
MILAATAALADDMENVPPVTHTPPPRRSAASLSQPNLMPFPGVGTAGGSAVERASRCVQGVGERRDPKRMNAG